MKNRLKTALILDDKLFSQVVDLFDNDNSSGRIDRFDNFDSFHDSDYKEYSVLVYSLEDVSRARRIVSLLENSPAKISIIIIYKEGSLTLAEYKDLIISGTAGLVPESNLKSLIQHLYRIQEDCLASADVTPLFDELLENYFNSNDSLVSLINSDLRYESVSESFSKFHNLRRDEFKGLSPSKLWGEDVFNSEIKSRLSKALGGDIIRYKAYFGKEEDSTRCYEVVYRPFKPRGSDKPYSLVETRDITDIEEALDKAKEAVRINYYYSKYLPFGIFECNLKGEIISGNETFYNILGIDHNGGKAKKVELRNYLQADNRFFNYLESVHEGESATFSQLPMRTGKGEEIFARISSHARLSESGEILVDATMEDNTREVLLEKKLNQSQKIETLGNLAGGIAHDFNTILTTITGYSELSMDEVGEDTEAYNYMSKILDSVRRAEEIVNQMLTFSRQIEMEHVPVKIEEVVEEVCNFMRSAMPYNIRLECKRDKIDGYADGDPTQLFRVFLNFLTNSMQALEENGGSIFVETVQSEVEKQKFGIIHISDTGNGIDQAIIDRIYEPFFTTKDPGKGSGMGLSVAHGIITGMGGEIAVESSAGKGSLFSIKIPVYKAGDITRKPSTGTHVPRKVLYADKNIYFSRTVSLALERLGYNVILVSDESDMNSYLEKESLEDDIIFFRCSFDRGGKDEILKKILEHNKKSRLVLISSYGTANYRTFSKFDKNRTSILFEPVSLRDIVSAIQNTC